MIITNANLQHTGYAGRSHYYHTATTEIDKTPDGADLHIVFYKGGHLAVCDNSINVQMSGMPDHPHLLTRMDIQSSPSNENLAKNFRLVSVSMPLQIETADGTVMHAMHQRNGLVPESGLWTQASGLVSEDPRVAAFHIAGLELGLVVGGKIVVPEPTPEVLKIRPDFKQRLESDIRLNAKKCEKLRTIFGQEANPFVYARTEPLLSDHHETVYLEGTYKGNLQAVVVDDPSMRTLSLFTPSKMTLVDSEGKAIDGTPETFDLEGLDRPYKLATPAEYKAPELQRTAALQQFLNKTLG